MDKRKITLTVIGVAVLLVVLVGSTYAYWTLNGTPKTSANVQVQTGGLILRLDDVNGITSNDVIDPNHLSFSKYFSITNESAADGYAKILFKGLTNTFVTDALVYDLEEVQQNKSSFAEPRMVITNEVLPKSTTSTNATLADGLLIEKGTISGNTVTPNVKYYKLTVRYNYSDIVNQSDDLNKTLVSGFTIEEGQMSVNMTISFNTNDENITNPSNMSVTMGQTYNNLPVLTKDGYRLEGWYSDNLYTERVTNDSKVLKSDNHVLYAKWKESKFECLDENNNEIICPVPLTVGTRIAIRDTENVQTFRYLRTTDDTSMLNECGTTSSIACNDTDSRNNIGENKVRMLAEYNLKATSQTSMTSNALQDTTGSNNEINYGSSNSNYSDSYLKRFVEQYASYLNSLYFQGSTKVLSGSAMTISELRSFNWGCPSSGYAKCSDMPSWAGNTNYWVRSPISTRDVWIVYYSKVDYSYAVGDPDGGARPVIMIDKDLL